MPLLPRDHQIHRRLIQQWEEVYLCARTLDNSVLIKPENGYSVVKLIDADVEQGVTHLEIAPTLFVLPESGRAKTPSLYIVLCGLISIDRNIFKDEDQLRMTAFNSRAAYFRRAKSGEFEHILGVHFDLAVDQIGHPAYHMQLDDYASVFEVVRSYYNEEQLTANFMSRAPKLVRIPCAQVDTFTLCIQLLADHLLGSSADHLAAFNELILSAKKLKGTGYLLPRFQHPDVNTCLRALHWYPAT